MNRSLPERRPFLLLIFLLASLLALLSHQVRTGSGRTLLEERMLDVTGPLLRVAGSGVGAVASIWRSYVDLRGVGRENAALRADLARMGEAERQAEEFRRENLRLRELLELRSRLAVPALAAEVLAVGTTGQARTALINRGTRDGVRRNLSVVNARGVVGRVIAAGSTTAKVQLLIDPNSGVAGLFQRSRGQGMVLGTGDAGCRMEYVSDLVDVEVGDVVVASGLDQIHPKGITIGVVSAVEEADQLTRTVLVRPEVDFRRLEEVLVLLRPDDPPEGAEEVP
jgi:rod shape-determining protein MreC